MDATQVIQQMLAHATPMYATFIDEDNVPHFVNAADCHIMLVGGKHTVQIVGHNRVYTIVGGLKFDPLTISMATFNGMVEALRATGAGGAPT